MVDTSDMRWRMVVPERQEIVVWGAADQGRVNRHILQSLGCRVIAWVDDTPDLTAPVEGAPLLHGLARLERWLFTRDIPSLGFVVAIGNPWGHVRCALHEKLVELGLNPISFADSSALVCRTAAIGAGVQVMPRAIIHNEVSVARECIVNTAALVEHDCVLEEGVEIGPGAVLCGRVHVGANSWIGAGSVIRQRIKIGRNVIIGAGAVVVTDIPDGVIAVGSPARAVQGKSTPSAEARV